MNTRMRFRKVGGSKQLVLSNAEDMKQILSLDPALWAVNLMPLEAVVTDQEFLAFLDTDRNKRIRPDELRAALSWLLEVLSDYSGIDSASDTLRIDALNPAHKDAEILRSSARLVLHNLKAENLDTVSLAQVRDKKNIIAAGNNNGDGIISPDSASDPELAQMIADIIACSGSKADLSGAPGIDPAILDAFVKEGTAHLDWLRIGENDDKTSPYGAKVSVFYALFASIRDKVDEYFSFCGALADDDAARFGIALKIDPLNAPEMSKFIQTAPLAIPQTSAVLETRKWLNPLWKKNVLEFLDMAKELGAVGDASILTETEWQRVEANFEVRSAWNAKKKNDNFDILPIAKLEDYLKEENIVKLRQMMADDLSVAEEVKASDLLRKLILYQRNMLEFVNNYVTLANLFDPRALSIVQPGYLIMDSRHFSLASYVFNITEHKKIISRSNICVIYLDLTTGMAPNIRKMTLAVAITSGTMRNIFVGKVGIFVTGDGVEWDAKVLDLVQQPVSFTEALQMPFYRLGDFAGKQADKFFSARSKDVETSIGKQVSDAAAGKTPTVVQQTADKQTPAVSGSMLLMGGGVGLAALGSSVAFIANSLKNVPLWNVVAVLFGIALTISAPILLVSLIKLWNRCISDFFAAGGWAVNPKMRLSRKMGILFTHKPPYPDSVLLRGDIVKIFAGTIQTAGSRFRFLRVCGYVLAVLIGAAAAYFVFTWCTGIHFF